MKLPPPRERGPVSVEEALRRRRSVREYAAGGLALEEAAQLLWAAQGVTSREGLRTAPSAGALNPLELYLVAGEVEGLPPGIYRYRPEDHDLVEVDRGDRRPSLARAALDQEFVEEAPAVLVFTGVFGRTTWKYGERGRRYVLMDLGHAAENVYLQATALGLGTVIVGAFRDEEVARLLGAASGEHPLAVMPVGRRGP